MLTFQRHLPFLAICISAGLLLLGCAATNGRPEPAGNSTGTSPAAASSGVRGLTLIDAGCPPARDATPCPDTPIAAKILVTRDTSTDLVAEATSDELGHFEIPVPPGDYVLRAGSTNDAPVPVAAPITLTVPPGQFITITIHLDSGVR